MGKPNKLKTAKISVAAEDMSSDGYYQKKHVRKAQRKERQKGKKVIKETMTETEDDKFLTRFVKKYKHFLDLK